MAHWFYFILSICCLCSLFGRSVQATPVIASTPTASSGQMPTVIRLPKPRSQFDIAHPYYVGLLRLALQKAADGRPLPKLVASTFVDQVQGVKALTTDDLLDVYWVGTDANKEQILRPIRIPLERGMVGFRKFIIARAKKPALDQVKSVADLRQLRACLGMHWPDVEIFQQAGLPVHIVDNYEALFEQVNSGACDYFPRGLYEAKPELHIRAKTYPDLVGYQEIIVHYPFAIYFFTSKQNEALATWIEQGLEQLISSGELTRYQQQHPFTRHVFPLTENRPKLWLELPNRAMSEQTNPRDRRYWLVPADFE